MSTNEEKLAAIEKIIDRVNKGYGLSETRVGEIRAIVKEPEITHISISQAGYGTMGVNEMLCGVVPYNMMPEALLEAVIAGATKAKYDQEGRAS